MEKYLINIFKIEFYTFTAVATAIRWKAVARKINIAASPVLNMAVIS